MHNLVFVYIIIIIIITDRHFAIWFKEHKLGWFQQCGAHQCNCLCNTISICQ